MTSQQDQKVIKVYLESKAIQEFLDIKDLEGYLVIKGWLERKEHQVPSE